MFIENRALTSVEEIIYEFDKNWNDEPSIKHYDFDMSIYNKHAPNVDICLLFFVGNNNKDLVSNANAGIYSEFIKKQNLAFINTMNDTDNKGTNKLCRLWLKIYDFEERYVRPIFDLALLPYNKIVRRCGLLVMRNYRYNINPKLILASDMTIKMSDEHYKQRGFEAVYVICSHRRSVNVFLREGYKIIYGYDDISHQNVKFSFGTHSDGLNEYHVGLLKVFNKTLENILLDLGYLKHEDTNYLSI